MTPKEIKQEKFWKFPKPKLNYEVPIVSDSSDYKVNQQKFYDEYHPSGHCIYDNAFYKDIPIKDSKGNTTAYHRVNRISLPIQKDSVDIVLAHLLGNKTQFSDSTVGKNNVDMMMMYKEFWETKNMDILRNDLIKSVLAVGDGAVVFYKDSQKKIQWKVLSFLDREEIYQKKDKFGNLEYFGRFYSNIDESGVLKQYCDIISDKRYTTYCLGEEADWVQISDDLHGFNFIPVVYHFRKSGAYWTAVQSNIENLEVMISRLSEDNKSKTKARYHLKTNDAKSVKTMNAGNADMVVTETDGDFKLVAGADISTQFKFEWESSLEIISNSLGMVFPKSKSSGDMPTGSMKMMFYPTERIVFQLINEFNPILQKINAIFKEGFKMENASKASEIEALNVTPSIKMFSPQDDSAVMATLGQGKSLGLLSRQTAAENAPYAANDEAQRLEEEMAEEAAQLALEINQPDKPKPKETK
jgi:hypothetical protein